MEYEVISTKKVCGKVKGERLTEDDIISAGGSVEHLLVSGHIKEAGKTPKTKQTFEPKVEETQVFEEPTFEVSDEINLNYEGDK